MLFLKLTIKRSYQKTVYLCLFTFKSYSYHTSNMQIIIQILSKKISQMVIHQYLSYAGSVVLFAMYTVTDVVVLGVDADVIKVQHVM